jgi:putative ABC transport system permease protein
MLRNYLTVAFRNLTSHRLHALINIGGLAVGLAACLLILLYVRDEVSYERWLPRADRIVILETTFKVPGRDALSFAGTPGPVKETLEKEVGSEIERAVRLFESDEPARIGDRHLIGSITYADPGFFDVFDLPMIAGDRDAALADNKSIILSQTTARAWFGDQPAIGNTVTLNDKNVFTVVGVFADLPHNTHLDLDAIALFDTSRYVDQPYIAKDWTSVNTQTYLLLRSDDSAARIAAAMPQILDRNVSFHMPGIDEQPSSLMHIDLMPLLDIHLHADKPGYQRLGSFAAVVAFSGIALLILVIACINFVNLATARAMTRAREVALRKVVGATRGQLIGQHLGEAVLTALLALVVALALVELALGPFNGFLHKELRLDPIADPGLLLAIVGLVAVVGVVGGLYPAFYLSRFQPARVLKANQSSAHGSSVVRTALVVFQFAISIGLIVCTATIYAQTKYARTFDVGFQHADRVVLTGLGDLPSTEAALTLEREIKTLPGVEHVAMSSDTPPLENNNNSLLFPTREARTDDKLLIEKVVIDPDFFTTYGVQPLAGRLFDADHARDYAPLDKDTNPSPHESIVINASFAATLGARPEDVVGKVMWNSNAPGKPMIETEIIGVVPDLYLRSVRTQVTPMLYELMHYEDGFSRMTVHVAPGHTREVLGQLQQIWNRQVQNVPMRTQFIDESLSAQYDGDAQRGEIFATFAVFAILIACLGLFGLASFSAQRRTKEIGMRKVLGASVLDIVRLLVWQFSRPVLIANVIAWPVSFYLMRRWLASFRYAIDLSSPTYVVTIFGGAAVLAMMIAWLTTAGHAYRVARANPGRALRTE